MPTRYVAHRGGAAQWPENSLTAFRNAIALGARVLEMDVHQTADGAVAVIHDPTLDRTSDGHGPVARATAADLARARLRGKDGALTDDHVPTLDEVLALVAPAGVAMLVEIKTPGQDVRYERHGEQAIAVPGPRYEGWSEGARLRCGAGMAGRAFVMAFNPAVLAEVRALAPAQRRPCSSIATLEASGARRSTPSRGRAEAAPASSACTTHCAMPAWSRRRTGRRSRSACSR
jgi:glycerophosphoryl diester phosphodiesterase